LDLEFFASTDLNGFLQRLCGICKNHNRSFEVAIRLTDVEMELFAKSTPEDIYSFAGIQKDTSLRWKQLF